MTKSVSFIIFCMIFLQALTVNCKVIRTTETKGKEPKANLFESIEPTPNERVLSEDAQFWIRKGYDTLEKHIELEKNQNELKKAKNVVIFIGDGMGISTITSGRIYKGQRTDYGLAGEEYDLSFDKFPNVALVKTYNVDMQVPDSAGTATAIFSGVKTRYEAVGVDVNCNNSAFDLDVFEKSKLTSLMTWAQEVKKDTGIITNTRITHATPAATFGYANYRYWECDAKLPDSAKGKIKDLARQLIEDEPGKNFNVILGGGYQQLGHTTHLSAGCTRADGLNLTRTWIETHNASDSVFVTTKQDLENVGGNTRHLLGLFAPDHMPYSLAKGPDVPSLLNMTKKAVEIMRQNENGFVLMVEGGLIDRAHHKNFARLAMHETSEFDDAVEYVVSEFGKDTLILVTADHSHSFTIEGYSKRGNDILGITLNDKPEDFRPFMTLAYANGPGFLYHFAPNNTTENNFPWRDPSTDPNRLNDPYYRHIGGFDSIDATHGGEDVALFAIGPNSRLIRGVIEQNFIAHFISYTGCFGPAAQLNEACSGAEQVVSQFSLMGFIVWLLFSKLWI